MATAFSCGVESHHPPASQRPQHGLVPIRAMKWLAGPFDRHDLANLTRTAPQVPGFIPGDTGLVVASQSGLSSDITPGTVGLHWGPEELIAAWH